MTARLPPLPPLPARDLEHVLTHTRGLWHELAGSRIFVTGGTGFFGVWLLESVAAANDQLDVGVSATVLSRDPQRFLDRMPHLSRRREFDWLCGNPASFRFPANRHDYLFHMATATSAHLGQTDPVKMLQTKLEGIAHVLRYARASGVRRMLVTSSGAVYGRQPDELDCIPEDYGGAPDPADPASAYGNGKRLIEQMCALAADIDIIIGRCFSFIGPHLPLDARFAAGNFLRDAIAGGPVVVRGDGTSVRSYLYAADLIVWLLTLLLKGNARNAYNVGSDATVTTGQLARSIAALAPSQPAVRILGAPGSEPRSRYVPRIAKAKAELGLDPQVTLDDAIRRTLEWNFQLAEHRCAGAP